MGTWASDVGLRLDPGADVPIGVQLDWGLRAAIAVGRVRAGEQLPALRDLAADLGVNHNTLRAAVARLEADGVLESRHGSGTFVAGRAVPDGRRRALVEHVVRLTADAGVTPRDLATALYVVEPERTDPDADAAERRALRDEIAVLDRVVVALEGRLRRVLPPEPAGRRGARLLDADGLRAQRDALVRRLAAAQAALDAQDDDEGDAPAPAATARSADALGRLRGRRPGIAPA